jgi:light-regulated signal transduction histidine kinase (bacteriophytochrome)
VNIALLMLITMTLASPAYASVDECSYDQTTQLEKLRKVAAGKPNARVVEAKRQVTWTGKDKTHWTVVYGGCAHFGFSVTSSQMRTHPAKQDEVLQAAVKIAAEYWDPADAQKLKTAIMGMQFEKRTDGAATRYVISRDDYEEFEVEHEFEKSRERIAVRWLRNF